MKCQRCNEREASVHLTKIVNGEKNEVYLCQECARETGQLPFAGNNPFAFQNLLKGLINPEVSSYEKYEENSKCEICGMTYSEFSKNGFFGCAECYNAFSAKLDPILKRIHGNNRHNGKVPKRRGGSLRLKREIEELRENMQDAVNKEDFEKAAEIRDQIKNLENRISTGGEDVNVSGKSDK
ncbi:MAG: UvrB/UvrC motif-containing protein [Halanaerobiales bacterium]